MAATKKDYSYLQKPLSQGNENASPKKDYSYLQKPLEEKGINNFINSASKNKSKSLLELYPEFKNPKEVGKGALEAAGTLASIAQPEIGLLAKVAPNLPKIANALVRTGAQGAYGAAAVPESPELGAGIGAGGNIISQLAGVKNPFGQALMRATLGAGAGLGFNALTGANHPYYAASGGATLGLGAPKALNALGIGKLKPGLETLEHLNQSQVQPAVDAAKRLKTPITPGEASGNPYVGKIEGEFGRSGEAAALKTDIGQNRIVQQKDAYKDLLDTIYDKSTPKAAAKSNAEVKRLYDQAFKWNLSSDIFEGLKKDPAISEAFRRVQSDPAYKRKLIGVPENNYAYLNQVKRSLDDMQGSALRAGEKDRALEFGDASRSLVKIMDKSVPAYGEARAASQKGIIRSKIQKAMKNLEIKGSTFFNKVLKNDDEFNKLIKSLKNVPEAQKILSDMRLAWKNLINIEKPNSSAYKSETGLNQSRNILNKLLDMWQELTGARASKEAVKFIHSGQWDEGFATINKIRDEAKREGAIAQLFSKLTTGAEVVNAHE